MTIEPIAYIYGDFPDKFGLPRQSGMTDLVSRVVAEKKFSHKESFRGLEGFEYIWLIWGFDKAENRGKTTVRPPRLGGNERMGVFATRSPYRPNSLGLSSVKLLKITETDKGVELLVSGADMSDGTPVYDIKPYLPYTDSHPAARAGFAEQALNYRLEVVIRDELSSRIHPDKLKGLKEVLSLDPRPSYQSDGRIYGFTFCGKEIKFFVENGVLTVVDIAEG